MDDIKLVSVPAFKSVTKACIEVQLRAKCVHLNSPFSPEQKGSILSQGFLHLTIVPMSNNNKTVPAKHIVNDKAQPEVQTRSPVSQNTKKLGIKVVQLSFNSDEKAVVVEAIANQYRYVSCTWSKYLKYCLKRNTIGTTKARPAKEKAKPSSSQY